MNDITVITCGYAYADDDDNAMRVIGGNVCKLVCESRPAKAPLAVGQMIRLLRAIFFDKSLKLKLCGAFRISDHSCARAIHYEFGNIEAIPNPDVNNHCSMGSYDRWVLDYIEDNDYAGLLSLLEASCMVIHFLDFVVMREFFESLYTTSNRCIELPDGTMVNPVDAVKWMHDRSWRVETA